MTDNEFIPKTPHPKQVEFLNNYKREVLFGGAAGGGKSAALLMAALQYVHVPAYNAILLRKTFADLENADALIDVSLDWLSNTRAKWNANKLRWTFPSGATLAFGHLKDPTSHLNYKGAQFQFIGFDEASDIRAHQMDYLRTRLRRVRTTPVPLRVRYGTNPGGISHIWLKERFGVDNGGAFGKTTEFREFIPSRIADNPSLLADEYIENLMDVSDPLIRQQLLEGVWTIATGTKFKPEWLKRTRVQGEYYILSDGRMVNYHTCRRVMTCDIAGTQRDIDAEKKGKQSWTVILVWDITPTGEIMLVDGWRGQEEGPDVARKIFDIWRAQGVQAVGVEVDGIGRMIYQYMMRGMEVDGFTYHMPLVPLATKGNDKPVRFIPFANAGANGKLYFPPPSRLRDWQNTVEDELMLWTGNKDELDDCVDACAWVAHLINMQPAGGSPTTSTKGGQPIARMTQSEREEMGGVVGVRV